MTPTTEERCCGNCKHWEIGIGFSDGMTEYGSCNVPIPDSIKTPLFVEPMLKTDGADCPAYQPKGKPMNTDERYLQEATELWQNHRIASADRDAHIAMIAAWLKKRDEERDKEGTNVGLWWSENELYLFDLCVGRVDYEDLGEFGAWVAYDHADNVIGRFDDDNTNVPESSARTSVVDSFNNWKAKYGIALRTEATNA